EVRICDRRQQGEYRIVRLRADDPGADGGKSGGGVGAGGSASAATPECDSVHAGSSGDRAAGRGAAVAEDLADWSADRRRGGQERGGEAHGAAAAIGGGHGAFLLALP